MMKLDVAHYKEFLLNAIPGAKLVSGGSHILCRCRECPDSSHQDSAHMYISIPRNENEPSLYYCFKCNCKGIVDNNTLIKWGIYDTQVSIELEHHNRGLTKTHVSDKYLAYKVYYLKNDVIREDETSAFKMNYINKRLGTNLNFDDLKRLKIFLNLTDLLVSNDIRYINMQEMMIAQLSMYFIGFISVDNSCANMRRCCKEGVVYSAIDRRYTNYKIFDRNTEDSCKTYVIPTRIDVAAGPRVKLHIAEGPFDILSVYLNLRNQEPGIYVSAAGNSFANVINWLMSVYSLPPYMEYHIYVDNDKFGSEKRLKKIVHSLYDPIIPVYVHRNIYEGEKDFGVPLNRINESIRRIR